MKYDWERISKNLTSKELYEIYQGQSNRPDEAIPYAKQELIIRDFDFENLTQIKEQWKQMKLAEEEIHYQSGLFGSHAMHIPLKTFAIIITIILAIYLIMRFGSLDDLEDLNVYLIIALSMTTLFTISENLQYSMQNKRRKKRISELKDLESRIENHTDSDKKIYEYDKQLKTKELKKSYRFFSMIIALISALMIASALYNYFWK